MIDISVSNLVKEFEVGTKILDGLTFQVDTGERVGLLGPNGCGKTTLLRILTGVMDYDEGEVMIAPGKRMGLISQIPVYPAGYTVEDVLATAFEPLRKMEEELARLTREMASGTDPALMSRYDKLTAAYETAGGYEIDTRINKVCNGLSIHQAMREQPVRRGKDPDEPGPPDPGGHRHPAAGRADEPSGPAGHRVAGGVPG